MLCQKCGLSDATVHRKITVFRQPVEEHLCEMCAGVGVSLAGLSRRRLSHSSKSTEPYTVSTTYNLIMVDKDGNQLGPPKEVPAPPEPEAIPNGLAFLPACLTRLYASAEADSCLIISTESAGLIGINRTGPTVAANIVLTHHSAEGLELTVREFFSKIGIGLKRELGKVTLSHARHLFFPLPNDCDQTLHILTDLLRSCFSVGENDAIRVAFVRA